MTKRYHKFTSYFEEVEIGTYITHAYSLDSTMERCACGKPIEELLTLPDIPAQHELHSCRRCLSIVEANRATLTLPDAPPVAPPPDAELAFSPDDAAFLASMEDVTEIDGWQYPPITAADVDRYEAIQARLGLARYMRDFVGENE